MMRFRYIMVLVLLSALCLACNEAGSKNAELKPTGNAALDKINALIQKDSMDHTLLYERAKLYYDNSYFDGAIEDLNRAISIDSLQADYYHLLSDTYLDYFRSREALSTMEKCVELFPERVASMLKLSETQLILKQYDESLQTCSNILSLNPQNAEAYFMMGMNLRSIEDIARAKNAFRKATELDPELTDAWIILGQIFEDEDNDKALQYYEAAINVDRSNPIPWHSKAFYLQNNGRLEEALDIYRQINIIDRSYLDAYLNAGILYMSMDSIDRAYEQFDIMTKVKPQLHLSYYYRGMAQEAKGNIEAAKEDYNTCLKLNSNYSKARQALNALLEQTDEG